MTHADSGIKPLGRSRDTAAAPAGAMPLPVTPVFHRRPVTVRVWGDNATWAAKATAEAERWAQQHGYEIAEVIPSTGTPCPIPPREVFALGQDKGFDWAWVAHSAATIG